MPLLNKEVFYLRILLGYQLMHYDSELQNYVKQEKKKRKMITKPIDIDNTQVA